MQANGAIAVRRVVRSGTFSSGDHTALFWHTVVRTDTVKKNARLLYDYSKADVVGMRR